MWQPSAGEKFNQDLSDWDTSNVKDMNFMFYDAKKFNQDILDWDVEKINIFYWFFLEFRNNWYQKNAKIQ
ncbi:BspA family leucine-rich repeat surface protein [Spiroplasma endosymbiont of Melieria omissa]|uniref:BspA family leucine-rich repeat surface protein n=1 Tax=Spiroplasma endosymbiont of Melieria omissa TaxID=3139324 RepID=UPI003CCB1B45